MTLATSEEAADALRELGNVAFSHAATALATLVEMRVDVSIPSVKLLEWPFAKRQMAQRSTLPYVVSVLIEGDQKGVIAVFLDPAEARNLLRSLLKRPVGEGLDEEAEGALMEVCNIMAGSALMAMDKMLGTKTLHGTPTFDRRAAIPNAREQRIVLLVEADFTIADHRARCTMVISPTDTTRLLARLGVRTEASA